jgi:RNase P/RNase MRP subunit p29
MKEDTYKTPQIYDKEVKSKIFFTGQNALQTMDLAAKLDKSQHNMMAKESLMRSANRNRQPKHLSKNTLKQIQRLHAATADTSLKYSVFEKMHVLWTQYIRVLLGATPDKGKMDLKDCGKQQDYCKKLVKADFSGAKILVIKSKIEASEGVAGIITRETARTFIVITKTNETKMVVKEGTVFQISLPDTVTEEATGKPLAINIWGDNFIFKGSERTKEKRFKQKDPLPTKLLDLY